MKKILIWIKEYLSQTMNLTMKLVDSCLKMLGYSKVRPDEDSSNLANGGKLTPQFTGHEYSGNWGLGGKIWVAGFQDQADTPVAVPT